MTPMTRRIYQHLIEVGNISAMEAQSMYKCRSLSRRICDIQETGIKVSREHKRDATGQRYVRYSLPIRTRLELGYREVA